MLNVRGIHTVQPSTVQGFSYQTAAKTVDRPESHFDQVRLSRSESRILRFSGQNLQHLGKNGIFLTAERIPAQKGGLGPVSVDIPMALNVYGGKDIRVIVPGLRQMIERDTRLPESDRYQPTGLVFNEVGVDGKTHPIEVYQKFEEDTKTWVYELRNEELFGHHPNLYFPKDLEGYLSDPNKNLTQSDKEAIRAVLGDDPIFNGMMMFNRAAAKLAPLLNSSAKLPDGVKLHQFDGDTDFAIANDWHTGPFFSEIPSEYEIAKIGMEHNNYDEARGLVSALKAGMKLPGFVGDKPGQQDFYSPLENLFRLSDLLIADVNYLFSQVKNISRDARGWPKALLDKVEAGLTQSVHHVPGAQFDALNNKILANTPGFTPLKLDPTSTRVVRKAVASPPVQAPKPNAFKLWLAKTLETVLGWVPHNGIQTWLTRLNRKIRQQPVQQVQYKETVVQEGLQEFMRFKEQNKLALQRMYGLKEDKDAILYCWVARFDANQKGLFQMVNSMREFMKKNPKAQLIIAGPKSDDPRVNGIVDKFLIDMEEDRDILGRFQYVKAKRYPDEVLQIYAGSTAVILPSCYEPYGLTQLEAMKVGTVPVVSSVDGLLSTVYDPTVPLLNESDRQFYEKAVRPTAKYGQTGFMMRHIGDIQTYQGALQKYLDLGGDLSRLDHASSAILENAESACREALERSYQVLSNPERQADIGISAMRYVNNEHQWPTMVQKYLVAIDRAMEIFQNRKTGTAKQTGSKAA